MIEDLRRDLECEEFDYALLMSYLRDYAKPRNKITRLIESESIIRVKKGIYVFGPKYRRGPICKEVLANWIYGPSYVSMQYALSYYGLIPERVETITSMTSRRDKYFSTPLGVFSYKYIGLKKFQLGVRQMQPSDRHHYLIAIPEKALCDLIAQHPPVLKIPDLKEYLFDDLRIDDHLLLDFNIALIEKIADAYRNPTVKLLTTYLRGLR